MLLQAVASTTTSLPPTGPAPQTPAPPRYVRGSDPNRRLGSSRNVLESLGDATRQLLVTWDLAEGEACPGARAAGGCGARAHTCAGHERSRRLNVASLPTCPPTYIPIHPPALPQTPGNIDQLQQLPDTLEFLQLLADLDAPPPSPAPAPPSPTPDAAAAGAGGAAGAAAAAAGGVAGGGVRESSPGVGPSDGGGAGPDAELPERRAARGLFRCVCGALLRNARAELNYKRAHACHARELYAPSWSFSFSGFKPLLNVPQPTGGTMTSSWRAPLGG